MRSVMHPMQSTTKKLSHLSHNNYRNIELRHSFHQIRFHRFNTSKWKSSDVDNRAVSVVSSVSDNCRNFKKFTVLAKFIHESQNEEGDDILSKANAKIESFWTIRSQALLVFSVTERPFVFRTILTCTFCLFYLRWRFATKVGKIPPSSCGTMILKHLFEAVTIIFPVKKPVFNGIRETVVKFTDCVILPWVWDDEWIGKRVHRRM